MRDRASLSPSLFSPGGSAGSNDKRKLCWQMVRSSRSLLPVLVVCTVLLLESSSATGAAQNPALRIEGVFDFGTALQLTNAGRFLIESGQDLSNWQPLVTGFTRTEVFRFTDAQTPSLPWRFYRATEGGLDWRTE